MAINPLLINTQMKNRVTQVCIVGHIALCTYNNFNTHFVLGSTNSSGKYLAVTAKNKTSS